MPITVTVLGEPVRGTNLIIESGLASGNAISGANLGSGLGFYKNVTTGTLNFKSLILGAGITSVSNTNDITLGLDSSYINSLLSLTITANKAAVSNSSGNLIASSTTDVQISYLNTLTSNVQNQINGKQDIITGAATTVTSLNLSPSTVVISNVSGKLASSTVTPTELSNLAGSTSNLQNQINNISVIPTGVIVMWSGTVAPAGWALCDGSGGRPDLRGMFIVGYNSADTDYNIIGKTGGEKKHSLTFDENGSHAHSFNDAYFLHESPGTGISAEATISPGRTGANTPSEFGSATKLDIRVTDTDASGSGTPHENRPPFYTLAYIIKL